MELIDSIKAICREMGYELVQWCPMDAKGRYRPLIRDPDGKESKNLSFYLTDDAAHVLDYASLVHSQKSFNLDGVEIDEKDVSPADTKRLTDEAEKAFKEEYEKALNARESPPPDLFEEKDLKPISGFLGLKERIQQSTSLL